VQTPPIGTNCFTGSSVTLDHRRQRDVPLSATISTWPSAVDFTSASAATPPDSAGTVLDHDCWPSASTAWRDDARHRVHAAAGG